jgi:hypothetical protein
MAMRRKLAVCSMFAGFACAYATLDRLPLRAAQVLQGNNAQMLERSGERQTAHATRRKLQ